MECCACPGIGHRIYLLGHGFEHAQDIPIGAKMRNYNGRVVELLAKTIEPEPELVYNFEVEGVHTYFVGDDAECCVLGHNQDCAKPEIPSLKPAIPFEKQTAVNRLEIVKGSLDAYYSNYLKNMEEKTPMNRYLAVVAASARLLAMGATKSEITIAINANQLHARNISALSPSGTQALRPRAC